MKLELAEIRQLLSQRDPQRLMAPRRAAVAIILGLDGPARVLLIRRTDDPKDPWSGHIAFPGGHQSASDPTLLSTAIRETHEEVGIALDQDAEFLGELDDLSAMARGEPLDLVISPFVFALRRAVTPQPDRVEVEEALWAPLAEMMDGSTRTEHPYHHRGRDLLLPAFRVGPHIVWGLTFRMLASLLSLFEDG